MSTFAELVASRKGWIEAVLRPWCQSASNAALLQAELEWTDIAGKVDPAKSLWFWAWSRFPALVNPDLQALDEALTVCVQMQDGSEAVGHPDSRATSRGQLVLYGRQPDGRWGALGPFRIDDVAAVRVVGSGGEASTGSFG